MSLLPSSHAPHASQFQSPHPQPDPPPENESGEFSDTPPGHEEVNENGMSRAPLLLRPSPAFGTGSYGASYGILPSPPELEEDERDTGHNITKGVGKGKSALRRIMSVGENGHDASFDGATAQEQSRRRRRRRRRKSSPGGRHSLEYDSLRNSLDLEPDSGLDSRFTGSALPGFPAGPSAPADTGSTSISVSEEDDDDYYENGSAKGIYGPPPPDDSPYAQVRASVPPYDNTTLSINTPRMWILSTIFSIFGSATNLFFSLRYPSVSITPVIALLIVHPVGLLWDKTLKRSDDPELTFVNGTAQSSPDGDSARPLSHPKSTWRRRLRLWLAQGSWNEKEHSCVFISSNVSFGFAFATDVRAQAQYPSSSSPFDARLGDCRANQILPPGSGCHLSDPAHPLNANPWICSRWCYSTLPCPPKWHDLARHPRFNGDVFQPSQARKQACRWLDHISFQVLPLCVLRLRALLLPSRIAFPSSELVQRCNMVCSEERGRRKPGMHFQCALSSPLLILHSLESPLVLASFP